jgi:Carboxypeptidase regulatory-like domain
MALALALRLGAQEPVKTPVVIHVTDPSGQAVSHASVRIVPGAEDSHEKLETDDKGSIAVQLKPGNYAVFVAVPGFRKATEHFEVSAGRDANAGAQNVAVALQIAPMGSPTAIYPKDSLVLSAELYHEPVALTPEDFHTLPHVNVKVHNSHRNVDETYSGVLLATLLAKVNAPMGKDLRGETMTTVVLACGTDGYSVALSLAEADPDFHANQILVADVLDGKPLGKNGPFQLVVPDDQRPARWVHNLNAIAVRAAQ